MFYNNELICIKILEMHNLNTSKLFFILSSWGRKRPRGPFQIPLLSLNQIYLNQTYFSNIFNYMGIMAYIDVKAFKIGHMNLKKKILITRLKSIHKNVNQCAM